MSDSTGCKPTHRHVDVSKSCPKCGSYMTPTPKSDLMGSADLPIHIQIYKCQGCFNEIKIPEYPETQTRLGDPDLLMKSPDDVHNDKGA